MSIDHDGKDCKVRQRTACPRVRTLVGYRVGQVGVTILPIRCKSWKCSHCRMVNAIVLKERACLGKPNRLLTLTLKPLDSEDFESAYKRGKPAIPRLWQTIRATGIECEAMTFLEIHRSGFPHWHCLVRSAYIPQKELSDMWLSLTGSFIVDIRLIKQPRVAAGYVTKYVTKQFDLLRSMGVRHIWSMTRRYLMEDKRVSDRTGLTWLYDRRHPDAVIEESYSGWRRQLNPDATETLTPPERLSTISTPVHV